MEFVATADNSGFGQISACDCNPVLLRIHACSSLLSAGECLFQRLWWKTLRTLNWAGRCCCLLRFHALSHCRGKNGCELGMAEHDPVVLGDSRIGNPDYHLVRLRRLQTFRTIRRRSLASTFGLPARNRRNLNDQQSNHHQSVTRHQSRTVRRMKPDRGRHG